MSELASVPKLSNTWLTDCQLSQATTFTQRATADLSPVPLPGHSAIHSSHKRGSTQSPWLLGEFRPRRRSFLAAGKMRFLYPDCLSLHPQLLAGDISLASGYQQVAGRGAQKQTTPGPSLSKSRHLLSAACKGRRYEKCKMVAPMTEKY